MLLGNLSGQRDCRSQIRILVHDDSHVIKLLVGSLNQFDRQPDVYAFLLSETAQLLAVDDNPLSLKVSEFVVPKAVPIGILRLPGDTGVEPNLRQDPSRDPGDEGIHQLHNVVAGLVIRVDAPVSPHRQAVEILAVDEDKGAHGQKTPARGRKPKLRSSGRGVIRLHIMKGSCLVANSPWQLLARHTQSRFSRFPAKSNNAPLGSLRMRCALPVNGTLPEFPFRPLTRWNRLLAGVG